jgi:hypothetical protein
MPAVADEQLERLEPILDAYPDQDGTLAKLIGALSASVEIVDTVARDHDGVPAWQTIRDPDTAPVEFLAWLGQHVGEAFTTGDDEAARRQRIRDTPRIHRGKLATLVAQVKATLTGNQTVIAIERPSGNQWALTIVTRTSETPSTAATTAAANYRKPVGIVITVVVSNAPIIDEFTRTIDSITATIDSLTPADVT